MLNKTLKGVTLAMLGLLFVGVASVGVLTLLTSSKFGSVPFPSDSVGPFPDALEAGDAGADAGLVPVPVRDFFPATKAGPLPRPQGQPR